MSAALRLMLGLIVFSAAASLALADEIHLKNGTVVQGDVVGSSADVVVLKGQGGELTTYRKADIAEIIKSGLQTGNPVSAPVVETDPAKIRLLAEYRFRKTGINPGEYDKNLELADWCLRNGLTDQAEAEVNALLGARLRQGFVGQPTAVQTEGAGQPAGASAKVGADDLAPFKRAFIFCARNQLESILLRIPTKTLNPKLLAMKQAGDPQLGNFTDFLQFARQWRDAPARISQLEGTIANLPQQRQALEEQHAALDNRMASTRGQPLFEGCPYCEGTGRMRTRFDPLNALNTYPRPLVPIEQDGWAPFGFEYVTCPYCGGTGFLSTGLGEQINKAQAQQQDIARQIADFQNYSNKLAQDLAHAEQTLESAGQQLEVSRAKLLAPASEAGGVH